MTAAELLHVLRIVWTHTGASATLHCFTIVNESKAAPSQFGRHLWGSMELACLTLEDAKREARSLLWPAYQRWQGKAFGKGRAAFQEHIQEATDGPVRYSAFVADPFKDEPDEPGLPGIEKITMSVWATELRGVSKLQMVELLRKRAALEKGSS